MHIVSAIQLCGNRLTTYSYLARPEMHVFRAAMTRNPDSQSTLEPQAESFAISSSAHITYEQAATQIQTVSLSEKRFNRKTSRQRRKLLSSDTPCFIGRLLQQKEGFVRSGSISLRVRDVCMLEYVCTASKKALLKPPAGLRPTRAKRHAEATAKVPM